MNLIEIAPIRAHLAAAETDLVEIGTARDLGAAKAATIAYPTAWLIALGETAGPNRYQTHALVDQRVTATFGVVLAVRDIGDPAGARAVSEAESVRSQVMAVLGAHVPPGADSACVPRRGRLVSGIDADGRFFWQDDYAVDFNRRITQET